MQTDMRARLTTIALILGAALVSAFFYKRYKVPPPIDIPHIVATDLRGQQVSLAAYSGRPLFISFFATWCGPCMRELPELAAMQDHLRDQQLAVVCISDDPVSKLRVLDQLYSGRLVFLHVESLHAAGIYTYPTNYIFNSAGKKIYSQVNAGEWASPAMVEQVEILLREHR